MQFTTLCKINNVHEIHNVAFQIIMVFSWVDYTGMDNGKEYDVYADLMGWGMTLVTIVCIVGTAIYVIIKTGVCHVYK